MRHPSRMTAPPPREHRPWADAWHDALYGPAGFYRGSAPAEHFATSAQGLPGGGALLAEAVVALARRHGCTRVVDVGCGRGELLARIREQDTRLHLTGVDVVAAPAGLDVDAWLVSPGGPGLPADLRDLTDTLVLAHEWLDVVPCPVVQRDEAGVWRTLLVDADGTEVLGPPPDEADRAWADRWLGPQVRRAEIGRPREDALADLAGRVRSGVVVVVDYGHTQGTRPPHGTLTGFRHGREVEPVPDGSCDLTAHLAVDAAADTLDAHDAGPAHVLTQREVLLQLLGDPTGPVPHALARTDPTAYLRAVGRRSSIAALTAPGGLGDFWWIIHPVDRDA